MLTFAEALPVGNAVKLYASLDAGVSWVRILRRTDSAFAGPNDPAAVTVADECTDLTVVDVGNLVNGTAYFYLGYGWNGSSFVADAAPLSATPAATYTDASVDPQELVRSRVDDGLAVEVAAGRLVPPSGRVRVLTAPFALADKVQFPVVSVHLDSDEASDRFVSDALMPLAIGLDGMGSDDIGWLRRVSLSIVGVSLNGDERIALRKAIRRVVQANLPIFEQCGLSQITFSQTDRESFDGEEPQFITQASFSCVAPAFITAENVPLADIEATYQESSTNG